MDIVFSTYKKQRGKLNTMKNHYSKFLCTYIEHLHYAHLKRNLSTNLTCPVEHAQFPNCPVSRLILDTNLPPGSCTSILSPRKANVTRYTLDPCKMQSSCWIKILSFPAAIPGESNYKKHNTDAINETAGLVAIADRLIDDRTTYFGFSFDEPMTTNRLLSTLTNPQMNRFVHCSEQVLRSS